MTGVANLGAATHPSHHPSPHHPSSSHLGIVGTTHRLDESCTSEQEQKRLKLVDDKNNAMETSDSSVTHISSENDVTQQVNNDSSMKY